MSKINLEEGKFYRAVNGEKVGPMFRWASEGVEHPFEVVNCHKYQSELWREDGTSDYGVNLVSEWSEPSPIRTVTRKEIIAGTYGIVDVADCTIKGTAAIMVAQEWTNLGSGHCLATSDQLREAAHVLNQIAEALDE